MCVNKKSLMRAHDIIATNPLVGGLYAPMGSLFGQFRPIDIVIVENCDRYH